MPLSIQFIKGSLTGRRFPVGTTALLVGRSHSCAVRPKEDDVSGRHVSLAAAGEALALTVLSRHRTRIDGASAKPGGVFALSPGSVVELGADLAFRVVDDAAVSPDDTSTLPGAATDTLPAATGTGTAMPTAATRFGGTLSGVASPSGTATLHGSRTATLSSPETGTLPGSGTDTLSAATGTGTAMPTAATRYGGTLSGVASPSGTATLQGSAAAQSAPDTDTLPGSGTDTLSNAVGTGTAMPTAATRFAGGDDTGTASLTAATRFGGDETATGTGSRTAATRFASETGEGETAIFDAGSSSSSDAATATESVGGETQVLQTQVASMEELDKLKAAYQQKKTRKTAIRMVLLGLAAAAAVGASIFFSTRKPEKFLSMPAERKSFTILPGLAPDALKNGLPGEVGLSYPAPGASIHVSPDEAKGVKSVEVKAKVGRDLDVEVVLAVDVFEDPKALLEPRSETFRRYLEESEELVKVLDNMYPLPDEDFFGGYGGIRRGIPCSRVEYWRLRGRVNVYGVVSFFRSGTLCCAFRREVPATEKERALSLLTWTRTWLYADYGGAFSAAQWEGAEDAGCDDPAVEIARCESRFAIDSPAEWPEIERGLRDILVETVGDDSYADVRSRAMKLLVDLRVRKALHWKRLVASRVPLSLATGTDDKAIAAEMDEDARKNFPSADEEWHFLARRIEWWKE